jgi:hypothetical protein
MCEDLLGSRLFFLLTSKETRTEVQSEALGVSCHSHTQSQHFLLVGFEAVCGVVEV